MLGDKDAGKPLLDRKGLTTELTDLITSQDFKIEEQKLIFTNKLYLNPKSPTGIPDAQSHPNLNTLFTTVAADAQLNKILRKAFLDAGFEMREVAAVAAQDAQAAAQTAVQARAGEGDAPEEPTAAGETPATGTGEYYRGDLIKLAPAIQKIEQLVGTDIAQELSRQVTRQLKDKYGDSLTIRERTLSRSRQRAQARQIDLTDIAIPRNVFGDVQKILKDLLAAHGGGIEISWGPTGAPVTNPVIKRRPVEQPGTTEPAPGGGAGTGEDEEGASSGPDDDEEGAGEGEARKSFVPKEGCENVLAAVIGTAATGILEKGLRVRLEGLVEMAIGLIPFSGEVTGALKLGPGIKVEQDIGDLVFNQINKLVVEQVSEFEAARDANEAAGLIIGQKKYDTICTMQRSGESTDAMQAVIKDVKSRELVGGIIRAAEAGYLTDAAQRKIEEFNNITLGSILPDSMKGWLQKQIAKDDPGADAGWFKQALSKGTGFAYKQVLEMKVGEKILDFFTGGDAAGPKKKKVATELGPAIDKLNDYLELKSTIKVYEDIIALLKAHKENAFNNEDAVEYSLEVIGDLKEATIKRKYVQNLISQNKLPEAAKAIMKKFEAIKASLQREKQTLRPSPKFGTFKSHLENFKTFYELGKEVVEKALGGGDEPEKASKKKKKKEPDQKSSPGEPDVKNMTADLQNKLGTPNENLLRESEIKRWQTIAGIKKSVI